MIITTAPALSITSTVDPSKVIELLPPGAAVALDAALQAGARVALFPEKPSTAYSQYIRIDLHQHNVPRAEWIELSRILLESGWDGIPWDPPYADMVWFWVNMADSEWP